MSNQETGGWRPPPIDKLVWKCPSCGNFTSTKLTKCNKCGEEREKK